MEIIRRADQMTTEWEWGWGRGATTRLAVHPPEASHSGSAFKWRMSSIRVAPAEFRLAPLPGFQRILMVLSGELRVCHEDRHEALLRAFDQDRFDGAWNTTGSGDAAGFDLSMAEGVDGSIVTLTLKPGQVKDISVTHALTPGQRRTIVLYVHAGRVEILLNGTICSLAEKDVLLLHEASASGLAIQYFFLSSPVATRIVQAVVLY